MRKRRCNLIVLTLFIVIFSLFSMRVHYSGEVCTLLNVPQDAQHVSEKDDGIVNKWAVLIAASASSLTDDLSILIDTNDVMTLKNILVSHGWDEDHILVLLEDEATTDAIMNDTFEWLQKSNEDQDDIILFLFQMHGQPLREDRPPVDEPDGRDEVFHPWDTEWGGWFQNTYIVDDALANKIETLKSKNIIIIFQTCYSGGMIDGTSDLGKSGRVVLTSSSSKEMSVNLPSKMQGVFTYYLTKGLRGFADMNKDHCVSVEEAFRYAEFPVTIRSLIFTILAPVVKPFIQHPQIYDGWPTEEDNSSDLVLIEL
jgi:hypothetical protein